MHHAVLLQRRAEPVDPIDLAVVVPAALLFGNRQDMRPVRRRDVQHRDSQALQRIAQPDGRADRAAFDLRGADPEQRIERSLQGGQGDIIVVADLIPAGASTIRSPGPSRNPAPTILSPSEAFLVNATSSGCTPMRVAACARTVSTKLNHSFFTTVPCTRARRMRCAARSAESGSGDSAATSR
jgi:hypothetical protein